MLATILLKGWRQFGGLWWLLPCFCIDARGGSRQARGGTESYSKGIQASFRDGPKGPESKTEPKTIAVKPFSRAASHLKGEGGVCAQAEHQPGLLSWHRNFCAEFQAVQHPEWSTVEQERWQSQYSPGRSVRWRRGASCAQAQPAKQAGCQPRLSTLPPVSPSPLAKTRY